MSTSTLGVISHKGKNFDSVVSRSVQTDEFVSNSATLSNGEVRLPNGTAAAPSLTFTSDTNTGLFRSAADALGITTGGTERVTVTGASTTVASSQILAPSGLGTAPGYGFSGDPDTGLSLSGAANILLSLAGTDTIDISAAATDILQGNLSVASGNVIVNSATNTLVYAGSGTVSQGTSNTTAVTLDTHSGTITMFVAVPASASQTFTVNNSVVAATSLIFLQLEGAVGITSNDIVLKVVLASKGAGSFDITVINNDGAQPTAGRPIISFFVVNTV